MDTDGVSSEQYDRYKCSYGCGNLYQFMVANTEDSTTEFLCLPCFCNLCITIIAAVTGDQNVTTASPFAMASVFGNDGLDSADDGVFEFETGDE